ncbi:MAG: hypothetical protein HKN25_09290 [Pyrinomonadaceae bacterium]|nr:hypothetical protein [Pyrinomonadaceae bacterium]
MKLIKISLLTLFTALFLTSNAFADSPLTSTNFSDAYADEPIVVAAADAKGVLNDWLAAYLANEYNPVDVKMAVVNKIGWKISGRNNSKLFVQYLIKQRRYSSEKRFLKKGRADELLSYAYLKALDNYFKVDEAIKIAEKAAKKNKKSRTFQLITGLIKAQKMMDSNWCEVYKITDRVRKNRRLRNDMRTSAVGIIYKYMDIYGDSCKESS